MKKIILYFIFIFLSENSFSQGYLYFDKNYDQILNLIIKRKNTVIEDKYPEYIHAVDTVKAINFIFFLNQNKCYKLITTYQFEKDFNNVLKSLDIAYVKVDYNTWIFDFDKGTQISIIRQKIGYFELEETYK